jgi:hypothetical protein
MRLAAAAFFHAALGNYNNGDFIHHTIGRIINITSRLAHTLDMRRRQSHHGGQITLLSAPAPDCCCCCWIILMYERAHMHIFRHIDRRRRRRRWHMHYLMTESAFSEIISASLECIMTLAPSANAFCQCARSADAFACTTVYRNEKSS